jgi:hypothetical protein
VANDLLKVHKSERKKLTSSAFRHIEKGRIPLAVHQASHAELLDRAIAEEAKFGSIKLCKSRKGIWYALISVSMEVPDAGQVTGWIGVDRRQNNIAVAALPNRFGRFWKAGRVKSLLGFACPLDLQKAVVAMTMADPKDGVNDSPLTGEEPKMVALAPS